MQTGAMVFPTADSMPVSDLAVELEQRGFESFWVPEHSHIPVKRESPWPGGGELPQMYYEVLDPIVALTLAAARTTTLRIGSAVLLLPQRDPIQLAKSLATLDVISGGRLEVGIGGGWNKEEMRNHGADPDTRFRRMREVAEAMIAIWTNDEAEYHGRQVDFDPIFAWPKPIQRPHPRIHIGGTWPSAVNRVVRYGDGWIPLAGRGGGELADQIRDLRERAAAAGRDPESIEVTLTGARADPAELEAHRSAGVTRVIFGLPSAGADETRAKLDRLAPLVERFAA